MSQQPISFHNIPAPDALIGVYASYFAGAKKVEENSKPSIKVDFGMRAKNVYDMDSAMEEGFGKPDSPWVMLDGLSDGRNQSVAGQDMSGGHFLTMYHKDTKQVMIALPGMEYDYEEKKFLGIIPADTIHDGLELLSGTQKQTKALHNYAKDIERRIERAEFTDDKDEPLEIADAKPIIASHSMGCKPVHSMAAMGYKVIAIEPRPLTKGYIANIKRHCKKVLGHDTHAKDIYKNISDNCVTVRAEHCNVWNSTVLPWVKQHQTRETYTYGNGQKATVADRHLAGHHAAEVLTPSLIKAFNPASAATQAPKGQDGMTIERSRKQQRSLLQDMTAKR